MHIYRVVLVYFSCPLWEVELYRVIVMELSSLLITGLSGESGTIKTWNSDQNECKDHFIYYGFYFINLYIRSVPPYEEWISKCCILILLFPPIADTYTVHAYFVLDSILSIIPKPAMMG